MEQHYKLYKVREIADGDEEFITVLAQTFIDEIPRDTQQLQQAIQEKDYATAYQMAHKMKPTIDLFELGVLNELIEVQEWGKLEKSEIDITSKFQIVQRAINNTVTEIKADFNL